MRSPTVHLRREFHISVRWTDRHWQNTIVSMKSTHNHCMGLIPLLTLALAVFMLVGCEKKPEKPKISEIFKTQLLQYLGNLQNAVTAIPQRRRKTFNSVRLRN